MAQYAFPPPFAGQGYCALQPGWERRADSILVGVRFGNGTVHFGSLQTGRLASNGMRQFGTGPAHPGDMEFRLIDRNSLSTGNDDWIPA